MASRPTWQGHSRLSLVACPVLLFPATTTANDVSLHLINPKTGNRIRQQVIDPETGEVERRDLVRGYEYEKGRYVLLTDEELRSVRLESTRNIDIERFVDAADIDRIWWNDPYYLAPDGKAGLDAFQVIRTALEQTEKVALGRIVLSTRERIFAIEPRGQGMLVTTLRSHDEVRNTEEVFADIPKAKPDPAMVEIAQRIIAQQEGPWDPSQFKDRYEDALRELIKAKQEGLEDIAAPAPRHDNVIDLMEALRRSLEQGGKPADKPKPAARKRRKAG
jgi:DNA end-binding protein Ku